MLMDLAELDPSIHLDVRYATANNFLGEPVYEQPRAFLQDPAAYALRRVSEKLKKQGYGLLVFDGYRPWFVTKIFWEATPADKREFVGDPAIGSRHNRGCAVDLTLYDLKTGTVVTMPSAYDEMTQRAYSNYAGGTTQEIEHRGILRDAMESEGFSQMPNEWWHYDYKDWNKYAIENLAFDQIPPPVYRPGVGGVTLPKVIAKKDPSSSEEALRDHLYGTVVLQVVVDEKGMPCDITVVRGLGHGLDEEAIKAMKEWRFGPARRNGKPVPVRFNAELHFTPK